jgi:hypothetical protein
MALVANHSQKLKMPLMRIDLIDKDQIAEFHSPGYATAVEQEREGSTHS